MLSTAPDSEYNQVLLRRIRKIQFTKIEILARASNRKPRVMSGAGVIARRLQIQRAGNCHCLRVLPVLDSIDQTNQVKGEA